VNPGPDKTIHADEPRLHALLLELDSPGALLTAAERVRDAGYTRWDTHTPYPVHGIDNAMGIRRTRLPWIVFVFGLVGCIGGLLLQWWTNATSGAAFAFVPTFGQGYNYLVSGKPEFSLPANIPIIFETTVLLAALAAVFGMLALNNLPRHHHPLFDAPRFRRVTADRFFIAIDAADPRFDAEQTRTLLDSLGGLGVEEVHDAPGSARLPQWLIITIMIIVSLALLPPLLAAKARLSKSDRPRIHLIHDMDNQERFKAQQAHPLFADGRAMRPPIPNTLAREDGRPDPHFDAGRGEDGWATTYPPNLDITVDFIRHGQVRFSIFCAACHGIGGAGDGIIHQRALRLDEPGWIAPTVLVSDLVRERELGHIFNTITAGIRSMPPHGDQIPPADRWAIVAYIRALELSQHAAWEDVPPEKRTELQP
jgi:mono/diheme cytochrome c family protein